MVHLPVILLTALLIGHNSQPDLCDGENLIMGLSFPNEFEGWLTICERDVKDDPRWHPFLPPPMGVEEAVRKTWDKLPLIEKTETRWRVSGVSLVRMSMRTWIYRVDWTVEEEKAKDISFAVTMSGKVIMPALTKRPE